MRVPRAAVVLFWIAVTVLPTVACLAGASAFPPGVDSLPVHWNGAWEIDRYGSPWSMVPLGITMSLVNGLMALAFAFNDALYDRGLVHGVSRRGALVVYCVLACFVVAVTAAIVAVWASMALAALV